MSSGCVPNKAERIELIQDAVISLESAQLVLNEFAMELRDPDDDPRAIESAVQDIRDALGCEYPNKDDKCPNDGVGLNWLMEHYFS